MIASPPDTDKLLDVHRFLAAIMRPGETHDLQRLADLRQDCRHRPVTADTSSMATPWIEAADLTGRAYVTLNPITPNRHWPKNDDVTRRRWLIADIDPIRPADTPSTDPQHDEAITLAHTIHDRLVGSGFGGLLVADSGNGAYVLAPIDLPNDEASETLVERALVRLNDEFGTEELKIDPSMYDAKRIARLIGTLNIKGQESTSERPWRRSRLLISPDDAGSDEELARRAEHAAHNTDFLRKIIAANPESAGAAGGRTEAAKALRAMGYGTQRQRASPGSGPPTDGPLTTEPHMTDMGNAQRLALYAAGDLLYVDHRKKWVTWDGCRWRIDITSAVQAMAKQCVRQMYAEAGQRFSAIATQLKTASVEGETL